MGHWFHCRKSWHKVWDFWNLKWQEKGCGQAQTSGSNDFARNMDHLYALRYRCQQDTSPDVVSMLKVFSIDVYNLFNLGAIL